MPLSPHNKRQPENPFRPYTACKQAVASASNRFQAAQPYTPAPR
ncbi:hypothetical protein [Kingella oralis]